MLAAVTDATAPDAKPPASPPIARRGDVVHELHGDSRPDPYAWMRDTSDPEVVAHLTAERAYHDAVTAADAPVADRLFAGMRARTAPEESEAPFRRARHAYLARIPEGGEYEQLLRIPLPTGVGDASWRQAAHDAAAEAEVILDHAALTEGSSYTRVGVSVVSPDERLLAYSVDTTGDEVYTLRFRDLDTGADSAEVIPRSYYTGAWSADSRTFFYTVHDEKYRPHQVWRHTVGTPASDDVLVRQEDDERYDLEVHGCRCHDLIAIHAFCRDTTEVWLVDGRDPSAPARCVEPRRRGVEYSVEHARTPAGDRLFITTNDGATEYRLMSVALDRPGREHWVEVVAEDERERLYSATAFAGHVVTVLRAGGRLMARAYPIDADGGLGAGVDIASGLPIGSLELGENAWHEASTVTVVDQSYLVPPTWLDVDLATGERTLVQRREAPNHDPGAYVEELIQVPVSRGLPWPGDDVAPTVQVPVSVVRRAETPLDGTAPCLIYAYGAYEACDEPAYDPAIATLIDEGVVFAHAHIRGGGEGGRRWWLDGRLDRKQNTFTDLIAVADHLADGLVDGSRLVTRGLSAGGLLQGAAFSQAPRRWSGVIAEVPFVDVVTTMLDPSIPLTINEWDEWGDPRREADYAWMKAYSPYDNPPPAGERPDLLATGALHDARVMVFEPAKWVALLRHTDPAWSPRCVFRVELGEGAHAGPSGRYGHLRYEADVYAWALRRLFPGT